MKKRRPSSVVVLGGGLAGLSTAYHLSGQRATVIEREPSPGGTARSFKIGGFTFDFTGHLLHLHDDYTRRLIRGLLKNRFFSCVRKTRIFSHGVLTRYPFQSNTYGLPPEVMDECVLGFLATYQKRRGQPAPTNQGNFLDWCRAMFGEGITRHFMRPYNEKLYQVPARRMTPDWCGRFVPMPKLEEVVRGALTDKTDNVGYNATFWYPKEGGIQALATALARRVPNLRLGTSVNAVDWQHRTVRLGSGEILPYDRLVNSIPLLELLKRMGNLPPAVRVARDRLRFASILCLNIGVARAQISDTSWIYFPEPKYPFYRVGFPMNFTPHAVPRGCSSMYVEVPWRATRGKSQETILADVRHGLEAANILHRGDKLPVVQFLPIRYAYVIYDEARRTSLQTIFSFFERNGIQSIGRYGAWKYSFMEEAILDGKKAAEAIDGR